MKTLLASNALLSNILFSPERFATAELVNGGEGALRHI
jgi:hypothetical protein